MYNFIINPDDRFYPDNPVHEYSIFLGKFTDSQGRNFDLAIYDTNSSIPYSDYQPDWCDATAHSNEPGDYSSGELRASLIAITEREHKKEVYRRAKLLNIIK